MAVTRCICFKRSFAQLLPLCRSRKWTTLAEVKKNTGCGTGCGGCARYIDAMLKTEVTCFAVIVGDLPPVATQPDAWDREA